MKNKRIGEVLVDEGMISPAQLQQALDRQKETSLSLGMTLVELKALSEDTLVHFLAVQHGMELVDLSSVTISADLLKICPEAAARKLHVLPLERRGSKIRIAVSNPENPALLHLDYDLVVPPGTEFEVVLAKDSELRALIDRHFRSPSQSKGLEETLKELEVESDEDAIEVVEFKKIGDDDVEGSDGGALIGDEGPVIKICNYILNEAVNLGASDIHINPYERKIVLRYRVDGSLTEQPSPATHYKKAIASRFKIMARLDPMERRRPQDGRIKYKFRGRSIDLRVSTLPCIWGENIVMRVIDQGSRKLDIKDMNFSQEQLKIFEEAYSAPYGMILVTGPTGSGKTTTLYSVLTAINDPVWNIMTAEDPVEYRLPHIIQCQVNAVSGLTFAAVLRSFLRQDPDVIMVGEIRDKETADIAVKAALTGHLVISTLHTNDAPATIMRLVDMGIDPMYVGTAVLVVCAQKLLRRICKDCSAPYTPSDQELGAAGLVEADLQGATLFKGKGCANCHQTGYRGRLAIHEVLKVNGAVRKGIFQKLDLKHFKDLAVKNGMLTMRQVAMMDFKRGLTTLEEVLAETALDK